MFCLGNDALLCLVGSLSYFKLTVSAEAPSHRLLWSMSAVHSHVRHIRVERRNKGAFVLVPSTVSGLVCKDFNGV